MSQFEKDPLTKRQAQVLAWIEESVSERGIAPSIPELMQLLGSTSPTISRHWNARVISSACPARRAACACSARPQPAMMTGTCL